MFDCLLITSETKKTELHKKGTFWTILSWRGGKERQGAENKKGWDCEKWRQRKETGCLVPESGRLSEVCRDRASVMLIWYRGFQCKSQWLDRYCRYRIQLAGIQEQQHIEKQSPTVSTHKGGGSNRCWYRSCVTALSNQTHQHIDSERAEQESADQRKHTHFQAHGHDTKNNWL